MNETWTVRSLLAWSSSWLADKGVEGGRLDSELLLAHALQVRRLDLFLDPSRPLSEGELALFKPLIKRRALREPVAYILGRREFWSLPFRVGPGVLIPRPDSEILVDALLARLPREGPVRLLDIGTGSGALLLSLLKERPQGVGVGFDISAQALAYAADNARQLGLAGRASFVRGNLLTALDDAPRWSAILSNPPYICDQDMAVLQPEVGQWEPHLALAGSADGLSFYRPILAEAPQRLLPGGYLAVEIAPGLASAVMALFQGAGLLQVTLLEDYGRRPRVVVGTAPCRISGPP